MVHSLTIHADHRGSVRESFRASWADMPPIRQLVHSESLPRTLRGMHLHRKQWDVWHFTAGEAWVRLTDQKSDVFVHAGPSQTLIIPPGLAHGFYTEAGCTLIYALTEEYDGTDEFGWYPFDGLPQAGPWPTEPSDYRISERDLNAPRLAEFVW